MRKDPNDKTIVRVWSSAENGGEGVGHVSIETKCPKCYMSLWPEGLPSDGKLYSLFEVRKPCLMPSYEKDVEAEGREPNLTISLYRLNTYTITGGFKNIINNEKFDGWTLLGKNTLFNCGNVHSCASLAYDLLMQGGLYDLISSTNSLSFSSVVTPDCLASVLKEAKKYEERKLSEDEPESSQAGSKPGCALM